MRPTLRTLTLVALAVGMAGCAIEAGDGGINFSLARRTAEPFEWQGRIAAGGTLEIKGVNGGVHATAASGDEVEVTATRSGRRSNPDEVRIEVVEHDAGVTICAVYPSRSAAGPNECRPGDEGRLGARNNDVRVEFTVHVPGRVRFVGRTVNGRIRAESLDSDVRVRTVNGSVRVSTAGYAEAKTVNGSITASLGRADWTDSVAFETVNGSITLELPDEVHAEVRARTTNGRIRSDLPITIGRASRRRLEGTIGNGGRELALKTVNGSIRLRRAS